MGKKDKEAKQEQNNRLLVEVAHIVWYMKDHEQAQVVRYSNMKNAMEQFDELLEAIDHEKRMVLTGPSSTCIIRYPEHITTVYLIDVQANNAMMTDSQRKMNAAMNAPMMPGV